MILFPNDTLTFYSRGASILNGEGIIINYNWALYKAVPADVQATGGRLTLEQWGLSNLSADARFAVVNFDAQIGPPMKVVSSKTGVTYTVLQSQPWPSHMELLLDPMQAGQTS